MVLREALSGTGTLSDVVEDVRRERLLGLRHAVSVIRDEYYEEDPTIAGILSLLEGEMCAEMEDCP